MLSKSKSLFTKTAALALALSIGASVATARKADAAIAMGMHFADSYRHGDQFFAQTLLCIVVLPFCILDEKANDVSAVTKSDLANNGYSNEEIATITADYSALENRLTAQNKTLEITSSDTRESIARDIRSVLPQASDIFVEFYSDQAMVRQ